MLAARKQVDMQGYHDEPLTVGLALLILFLGLYYIIG
jgi:hypothetical protein